MDGKKKLEELVAGLVGVTEGPWREKNGHVLSSEFDHGHRVASSDLMWGLNRSGANARHIARCDPDTIRSISDAFKAMEAERDELRSLVALAHPVMRECGWHLAVASEPQGDGVLEAACAEIEDKFAAALSRSTEKEER